MTLLTAPTATITFQRYDDIRAALLDPQLSRSFDRRSYAEGNIREGIVSISHGSVHRARRRIENQMFRAEVLRLYERDLFPRVMEELLAALIDSDTVDLFPVAETLSVALAARRAGIDHDPGRIDQLRALVRHVDAFSQGAAILDAKDPDAVRALVRDAYRDFERDFVHPSWARRAELIAQVRSGGLGEDELPQDILTVLLRHRDDPQIALDDDGRIVREVATYLQGGTHTSAQTLINALDLMFALGDEGTRMLDRAANDVLFAQRAIAETLRLRPTTPKIRRRAEADTTIAGTAIPRDAVVVLDVIAANRDAALFGDRPDEFDPDRRIHPDVARWGLSFGGGPHQCPGRAVGGGFPIPPSFEVGEEHVHGLVALELQAVARRGASPDASHPGERDTRTERFTRWAHYWVRFSAR